MELNAPLAAANATFTLLALACGLMGRSAIRTRRIERHRAWMIAAFAFSCLFVLTFVARVVTYGITPFRGAEALKPLFFGLWLTHDMAAIAATPLFLVSLALGLQRKFRDHKDVVKVAWPVWVYTSVTGLLLYLLLYQLPPA